MGIRQTVPDTRDGLYYFDEDAAQAACDFFPEYLRLYEGEWAGKPIELFEFQTDIIRDIFGWKRVEDGTRRYRIVYVWIPRKNGKSSLAAGIALLLLFGDGEPGAQIFCIARTKSQSEIVFNFVMNMLAQSPELASDVTPFKTAIWLDALKAKIQALSGTPKGKHGLNAHGIIGDELHEWRSDDLYNFVHQSEGTRRQPMDFLISTAGTKDGVGYEHYKLCEALLNGEVQADDVYVFIASADAQKDQDDPNYWMSDEAFIEANPAIGKSVKLSFLRDEANKARVNPRMINEIKRYFLDLWVDQATVWLNMARWDACAKKDTDHPDVDRTQLPLIYRDANLRWQSFPELFRGRRCLIGIDLASTTDLTAAAFVFPPDDDFPEWAVIMRYYVPAGLSEADMDARIKRDNFDYRKAAQIGAINLTEGDVIDYEFVRKDILAHADMFQVDGAGIDPWNALETAAALAKEGLEIAFVRQGYASLSGPAKYLERLVLKKAFDHGGHPVLRYNARCTAVMKDGAENLKPVKDKSAGRIDGIVATIIAIAISEDHKTEPSVYETRGVQDA